MKAILELEACKVAMLPSLPWLMALHIGMTSGPRISPTITRSVPIRSAQRTSSAWEIAPSPSTFGSRAWNAVTSAWMFGSSSRPSSKASSIVTIRSIGSISAANARSRVVLPDTGTAGDQDVLARFHQRAQELLQAGVDRAASPQLGQRDGQVAVPADRQRGHPARGHAHHREQPLTAGQLEIDRGRAVIEAALLTGRHERRASAPDRSAPHWTRQSARPGRGGRRCTERTPGRSG